MQDLFDQPLAIDPNGNDGEGAIVADAEFQVFLPDDLSFATPLAVTDPVSGLPITPLRSSSIGQLPQFRVEGDPESVILKSGSYAVRVLSPLGIAKLAVDLAGLSPAVVQQAIAAVDTTAASASTALAQANLAAEHAANSDESREAAVSARADAIAARDAAQAVGTTTDAIVAPILSSPSTASGAALRATFVQFRNHDGSPIAEGTAVIITLSADGSDIEDITVEEA